MTRCILCNGLSLVRWVCDDCQKEVDAHAAETKLLIERIYAENKNQENKP